MPIFQLMPMFNNFWLASYYVLWALYFYFSVMQIREGYPFASYKSLFKTDTSHLTFFGWKLYYTIPFIWELKVITDWTVTATCLELT